MKKLKLKIFIIPVIFSGCVMDSYKEDLKVVNKSTSRIYYTFEFGTQDTSITDHSPQIKNSYWDSNTRTMISLPDSLMKSKKYYEFVRNNCLPCKGYLEPNDTSFVGLTNIDIGQRVRAKGGLQVFFFNADTVELYDWAEIQANYKILERQVLTVEELKQKNWIVAYSPLKN